MALFVDVLVVLGIVAAVGARRALRVPGRQDGVGPMSAQDIVVGLVALGVLLYLFWALINPERL